MKSQAEMFAELNARCDGPNQFENFDRAFRKSLTVSKVAVLKEEARLKRARAKKRPRKPAESADPLGHIPYLLARSRNSTA
jgi:hypothetical protein